MMKKLKKKYTSGMLGSIYLNKNKKQFNLIIVFILGLFNISNIYSYESIDSVFLKYEKPSIDFKKNLNTLDSNSGYAHLQFSILLKITCNNEGTVLKIKFDKIISQTSSEFINNKKLWEYIENQITEASKNWLLNINNLIETNLCDEAFKLNNMSEIEYNECKKYLPNYLKSIPYYNYIIIFDFSTGYLEHSIPIIKLELEN